MDSRYQVTTSPIVVRQRRPGSAWLGVLVGLLTEWGMKFVLLAAVISVSLKDVLGAGESDLKADQEAVQEFLRAYTNLSAPSSLYWFMGSAGLASAMLAGLLGARVARRTHCWPGLIHAAFSATLTVRFVWKPDRSGVITGISVALVFLCILLGAWLGRERTVR